MAVSVSLQPVHESESVKTATEYMLPALYGPLFMSQIFSKSGGTAVKGRMNAVVVPIVLTMVFHLLIAPINRGIAILVCIPITVLCSFVLNKAGQIKVIKQVQKQI